jgi:hypothetical protein
LFLTLNLVLASAPLVAQDRCGEFTWDVTRERGLFAQEAVPLSAGRDAASAPPIVPDRLYQVTLSPQADVHLSAPPGHKPHSDGGWSGLIRLPISRPGVYRVSLSEGDWIDVVRDGAEISSEDHQGRSGCSAPHKVVQFRLPSGEVVIQLSGASSPTVKLAVTTAPPGPDNAK